MQTSLTTKVLAALLLPLSLFALETNYRLCFPPSTGVPYTPGPPTINGTVAGDLGWTGAFRYDRPNGTPLGTVAIQANRGASGGLCTGPNGCIYFSFEVLSFETGANPFSLNDAIVIVLAPPGAAAGHRRIIIFPVENTGALGTGYAREIDYWTDSSTWNAGAAQAAKPLWLQDASDNIKITSAAGGAGNNRYAVEVRIPIDNAGVAGVPLPAAGDFGIYLNVVRTSNTTGTSDQTPWPPDAPLVTDLAFDGTPPEANWAASKLGGGSCNGVSFQYSDITTNQIPTSKIALNAANIFTVQPHNTMINGAGTFLRAGQVKAVFKIANFGLPSQWQPIPNPVPGGAESPSTNIPQATLAGAVLTPGVASLSTPGWTLTPAQQADYNTPATDHQCVLVELTSTGAVCTGGANDNNACVTNADCPGGGTCNSVVFINHSAWRNMDFGNASIFERAATIDTRGYREPKGGVHKFDLLVSTKEERVAPGYQVMPATGEAKTAVTEGKKGAATGEKGQRYQYTWVAQGYRHLDNVIILHGKTYQIVDPVGAFGFVVVHSAATAAGPKWGFKLNGAEPGKGRNEFGVRVSHGQRATLNTRIEAQEKPVNCRPQKAAVFLPLLFAGVLLAGVRVYRPRRSH